MSDWRNSETWRGLSASQRMALMAMMERDRDDLDSGLNVLHANNNRARKLGWDTDRVLDHKGRGNRYGWFQPLDEPMQQARAPQLLQHPDYQRYVQEAESLRAGSVADRVGGATHYLSHAPVMLGLEAREPAKYKSWRSWTGFNPETGQYRNQTVQDRSHSFLAPEGLAPPITTASPHLEGAFFGNGERPGSVDGFRDAAPVAAAPRVAGSPWDAAHSAAGNARQAPANQTDTRTNAFDVQTPKTVAPGLVDFGAHFKPQEWRPVYGR